MVDKKSLKEQKSRIDPNSWENILDPNMTGDDLPFYHFCAIAIYNWKTMIWNQNDHLRWLLKAGLVLIAWCFLSFLLVVTGIYRMIGLAVLGTIDAISKFFSWMFFKS